MVQRIPFHIFAADRVNASLAIYDNIANVLEYASFQKQVRPVLVAIYCVIVILGSLGNIMVMTAILCDKHMRRKATYIFICSLSISDLLFLLVSLPLLIAAPSLDTWPFGKLMCKAIYYFEHLNGINSVFTLVGLSADRLYGTRFPIKSKLIRSMTYAVVFCAVIWLVSALVSITAIYCVNTTTVPTLDNSTVTYCLYDADATTLRVKAIALFLYGYVIPLLILVGIYYVILSHLKTQRSNSLRTYSSTCKREQILWAQRRKVTLMAITVVAVFFICWFPFHLLSLYRDVIESDVTIPLGWLSLASCTMMFSNSALNPVIYAFISDDFRKGIRKRFVRFKLLRRSSQNSLPNF